MAGKLSEIAISDIKIGERSRKHLGDLGPLCQSIADIGLLHPIVITERMELVAGLRRLKAFEELGLESIPATQIRTLAEALEQLKAERDENVCRLAFAPSEAVAIGKKLEALERPKAKERQREHGKTAPGKPKNTSGKLPQVLDEGRTRDKVAEAVGMSGRTLEMAKAVVDSGDQKLIEEMDRTGRVAGAYRKHRKSATKTPALPKGKFRIIYADPPWQYSDSREGVEYYGPAERHYQAMSIVELCDLDIEAKAANDSVLFLWVTSPMLEVSFRVIRAWGFAYKASFVWDKVRHNYGHYNSVRHEFLLIATRGSCTPENKKLYDSVQTIARSKRHSQKPDDFRRIIDTMYPNGPRIELFAREEAEGWSAFGNELPRVPKE